MSGRGRNIYVLDQKVRKKIRCSRVWLMRYELDIHFYFIFIFMSYLEFQYIHSKLAVC